MFSGWFDGGSRGNPGLAGAGWVLRDPEGALVQCGCVYVGHASTNNVAEYAGLVALLEAAVAHNVPALIVHGDSLLVIQQMQGAWQIRHPSMRQWHDKAAKIVARISRVQWQHVLREFNKEADLLSNVAMDTAKTEFGAHLLSADQPAKAAKKGDKTTVVRIRREHGQVVQDCDVWVGAAWTKGGWRLSRSEFCNPFYRGSPEANLDAYIAYVGSRPDLLQKINTELRGWRLGCFCESPEYCHAVWLAEVANDAVRWQQLVDAAETEQAKKSINVCNE